MSSHILTIGPAPCEENCAQVGSTDYDVRSRRECLIYQRMLARLFPLSDEVPAHLIVKTFLHDFGSYREVCVRYDDGNVKACHYAFQLEAQSPAQWDAIARYELIWLDRREQFRVALQRGELQPQEMPERYRDEEFPDLPVEHSFDELLAAFPL